MVNSERLQAKTLRKNVLDKNRIAIEYGFGSIVTILDKR